MQYFVTYFDSPSSTNKEAGARASFKHLQGTGNSTSPPTTKKKPPNLRAAPVLLRLAVVVRDRYGDLARGRLHACERGLADVDVLDLRRCPFVGRNSVEVGSRRRSVGTHRNAE